MARLYADAAAYEAWTQDTAPANVDTLLRMASRMVDRLLTARVYDTDAAGMPTDPDDVQAMSDATCAIAAELDASGVLAGGGGGLEWDSVSIGNVSLSGRNGASSSLSVGGVGIPPVAQLSLAEVGQLVVVVR